MKYSYKRLYRSKKDRVIGGVCGGFAHYFEVDPVVVRIVWLLMTVLGGSGILLYIVSLIIIPEAEQEDDRGADTSRDLRPVIGAVLIVVGSILLMDNLGVLEWLTWDMSWNVFMPILFIVLGLYIILNHKNRKLLPPHEEAGEETRPNDRSEPYANILHRSSRNKKILGVCGGIAEYFGVDPSLIRIAFVLLLFVSFGLALILYVALAFFLPVDQTVHV